MSSGLELRVGNKYRLGRKIGSGSFGDIYLGTSAERIPRLGTLRVLGRCVLRAGGKFPQPSARAPGDPHSRTADSPTSFLPLPFPQARTFRPARKLASSWCVPRARAPPGNPRGCGPSERARVFFSCRRMARDAIARARRRDSVHRRLASSKNANDSRPSVARLPDALPMNDADDV